LTGWFHLKGLAADKTEETMRSKMGPHHLVDIPIARRIVLTFIDLEWGGHCMYGLLEVDVTVARQFIEAYKVRTGERLSFTAFIASCLARAVDEDKSIQAYRKGRKQLVVFEDVDVGMMIERRVGDTLAPVGHVIRRANHKTFLEIHQEVRAVQNGPAPQRNQMPSWLRLLLLLPGPLEKLLNALLRVARRRDPQKMYVATVGTIGITAVGMFGNGSGWGLAPSGHTLWLVVGGISRKPAIVEERIEPREFLSLTVGFDHDVVDGAPAARFTRRLVDLIESGYGLDEEQLKPALVAEPAVLQAQQVPV
jgi:pyruvate/2-oxoglutarate dehydrogenase complex dihydrolipoamide acyltransferase (E2) component